MSVTVTPSEQALAVHAELLRVCRHSRQAEHRAAVLLATVQAERLHHELGYASVIDYAEQALDLSPRQARDLLHLGRSLPDLPVLDAAFAEGRVGWTKAREVLRVVTQQTEAAWVERAESVTSRELERLVATAVVGDPPPTHVGHPLAPERTRLVFETATVDADTVRAALQWFRAATGASRDDIDDGALLAMMAQRVMHDAESSEAPTAERYRIVVEHCPECGRTAGLDAELPDSHVGEAACDAEHVEMRDGPDRGHMARAIPPATRRAVLHRDRYRCAVPGCSCRVWLDIHHLDERQNGGDHRERNLVTVCSIHHRLTHVGRLRLERVRDEWVVEFGSGRVRRAPVGGAPPCTHATA